MNELSTRDQLLADLNPPLRHDRPTREELKSKSVTMSDAAPVLSDYVNGVLMTREEWEEDYR